MINTGTKADTRLGKKRCGIVAHQGRRSDVAAHPEHDRRHVADGRPGPAAVGGNHDDAAENPALLIIADQFSDQHDHDDGSSQVV